MTTAVVQWTDPRRQKRTRWLAGPASVMKDSGAMRKENHSHKPAGQRRTTDLGQATLEGNAQTEEPLKVKKYSGACPVLGLVPAVPWDGRPPVLAHLVLYAGAFSPHGRFRTESTLAPSCQVRMRLVLPQILLSSKVHGNSRPRAPALRQRFAVASTPSTAPFNGVLHSWSQDS